MNVFHTTVMLLCYKPLFQFFVYIGITECLQGNKDVDQYSLHDMEEGIQNVSCFDWVCEKYNIC